MRPLAAACILASALLGGCVTTVSVTPAAPDSDGIRYFLPEVFIRVVPKADGTMSVEKLYLPDPAQEYVINTRSFLGNYTLDINRNEKGFLESVSFEADSSAVAKQLAASAGNVRAAEIDAQLAKAKADATEAKGAADKVKAALEAADKTRKDAATIVDAAERKLALLEARAAQPSPPTSIQDQILAARISLVEAQAKRDAAERAYAALVGASADSPAALAMAEDAVAPATPPRPTYPGPVFYRVVMAKDDVKLIEAFPTRSYQTWSPRKTNPLEEVQLVVLPAAVVVRPEKDSKALTVLLKASHELLGVLLDEFVDSKGKPAPAPLLSLQADRLTLRVELPRDLPAGDYELDATFTFGTAKAPRSSEQSVTIRVEK